MDQPSLNRMRHRRNERSLHAPCEGSGSRVDDPFRLRCPHAERDGYRIPCHARSGLASLELVLWLPVLVGVAALMVNYGTMSLWRTRGEIVAHDAAWRARSGRSGATEGRLRGQWPLVATMTIADDPPLVQLDDPNVWHPVVHGPNFRGFGVNPVLDPDFAGAYRGISDVRRRYPFLPRLGPYVSGEIAGSLLDRRWQHWEMGIANVARRIPVLYDLPWPDKSAFNQAVAAARNIPHASAFIVLGIFREVFDANLNRNVLVLVLFDDRPLNPSPIGPFYPTIRRICELDREVVRRQEVERLVDTRDAMRAIVFGEISRLPRTVATAFLQHYESYDAWLRRELNPPPPTPPPTPQRAAQLQAELARIQPMIQQLRQYLARMDSIEAGIRQRADAAIP